MGEKRKDLKKKKKSSTKEKKKQCGGNEFTRTSDHSIDPNSLVKETKHKNSENLKPKDRKRDVRQTLIYFYLGKANTIIIHTIGEALLIQNIYFKGERAF